MPDSLLHWPLLLADAEAFVTGNDTAAYRTGWSACMAWEARVPPEGLSAEEREEWFRGFDDAMDAPLGSGPELCTSR